MSRPRNEQRGSVGADRKALGPSGKYPRIDTVPPGRARGQRAWPFLRVFALLILAGVISTQFYLIRGCRSDLAATRTAIENTFNPDLSPRVDLTIRFLSMAPELSPGSALELARLETIERIERSSTLRFLGIESSSRVELEVPVSYRYGVPWDREWRITLAHAAPSSPGVQLCRVEAPGLEALLPPAIETEDLRIRRVKDWKLQRFDRATVDSVLIRLTPELSRRAADPDYENLVREMARKQVEFFVRLWVLRQPERDARSLMFVDVRFADDPAPMSTDNEVELPAR